VHRTANVTGPGVWIVVTIALSSGAFITLAILGKRMTSPQSSPDKQGNKKLMTIGFVVSIASILVATLVPEESPEGQRLLLNPTDGMDELQAPGNVALFVSLGAFLRLKGTSRTKTLLGAVAFSIAIEMLQFFVIQGRSTSTSDVILNTTGALVGHVIIGHTRSAPRS
jgi:VanZ family protein